jgi:thioredoxin-dependent peroxiredoxin
MRIMMLLAVAAGLVLGRSANAEVKLGDAAPSFESTSDDGKAWKSADHVGKKIIVLYFYPADFTGGCTAQACAYRDDFKKLTDKGVEIVGVSGDTVKNHELFKKEHKLPFTLLADSKGEVAKSFGVPMTGPGKAKAKVELEERGATIKRWTFVIGKDGKIAYMDNKVVAAEDSKKIAEVVDKMSK